MKSAVLCAIPLALAAACTVEEPAHKAETPAQAPVAVHPPATTPAAAPLAAPLMSQDEADSKAAKAITKENADAELEKLKKELAGG